MNQNEFNKEERFKNLIEQTVTKNLGYRFIVDEFKRNRWNINLKQAEEIGSALKVNIAIILFYADDINILNVDKKTLKAIRNQKKNKDQYYE